MHVHKQSAHRESMCVRRNNGVWVGSQGEKAGQPGNVSSHGDV